MLVAFCTHHHAHARGCVDVGAVGEAHGRRILHRRPRARLDRLRLAEHEWALAGQRLLRRHPLQRIGGWRGAVIDTDLLRLRLQGDAQGAALLGILLVEHEGGGRPVAVVALHLHARDLELARVEHQGARRLVDPVQRQFRITVERLAREIGFQVQVQVGGAHLVVARIAQRILRLRG